MISFSDFRLLFGRSRIASCILPSSLLIGAAIALSYFPLTHTHMPSTESAASFLYLPWYAVSYLRPRRRQNPEWTYRQAILNTYLKISLHAFTILHIRPSLSLRHGFEGKRFVLVEPAHPVLYNGVTEDKEIKPETIGGTWYPRPFSADPIIPDGYHVVLHLHGGSYMIGDGRSATCRFLAKNFLAYTPSRYVFCPQYRLAGNSKCRFPAQLQDAITAYSYLINTLRIPASRIVLSGDSSGGHLVLGLLRYIAHFDDTALLPEPKCSWLWSPWCDILSADDRAAWIENPNYPTEYVPSFFPAWGSRHFLADLEITELVEEYMVPLQHPFPLPSPMLVVSGGQEVLCQEHRDLTEALLEVPQNESAVKLYVEENVPHDILMVGWIMNFREETRRCCIKAGEFLEHLREETEKA